MKRWLRTYSPYSARILAFRTIARAAISGVSGKHKVTVNGIKNGSFTLELTVRNAGGSIKFQYPDVSVVNGTVAQFVYTPSEVTKTSQPALSVTSEGTTTTINAVILSVSEPTQTTGSLKIFVKDEKNALLSGVVVSSTSQPAGQVTLNGVTDSLGSVEFKSAASGTYSLMASKKGYDSSTVSIVVMNGKTSEVTIVIKQGFFVIPDNPLEVPGYPPQSIVLGIILSLALLIMLRARHDLVRGHKPTPHHSIIMASKRPCPAQNH
jgi:hypothetical protein